MEIQAIGMSSMSFPQQTSKALTEEETSQLQEIMSGTILEAWPQGRRFDYIGRLCACITTTFLAETLFLFRLSRNSRK